MKKILVSTGGGDCPGLNAVIRAITRAARRSGNWEVWGSMEALNGVMQDPPDLMQLTEANTAGIHIKGGTMLKTTNLGNPLEYPVQQPDGSWKKMDITPSVAERIRSLGFDVLINIGGDGSQRISQALWENGLPVIGVPKTIDNDLHATDLTFGFTTAVQIATDSFDKLVTTAESHHRVMIMEVMGRDAGWIALHTAIAGGAEICLIPEIPFDLDKIMETIRERYEHGKGFVNIVIAEGAKPKGGKVVGVRSGNHAEEHIKLGGVANYLRVLLEEAGCPAQVRATILGHVQRGGTPVAFDRILATAMGAKAFELADTESWGRMVAFKNNTVTSVAFPEVAKEPKLLSPDHYLLLVAKSIGISFGD